MNIDVENVKRLVLNFFKGDKHKLNLWMATPNTLLGGLTPEQLGSVNAKKLLKFVTTQLAENLAL